MVEPVRSLTQPTITGLTMPPNWPSVLISAMPPALYGIGVLCLVAAGLLLFAMPASLRRSDRAA